MINSKAEIIKILDETYEQEKAIVPKGADQFYGLKIKLIQTTEQFARSFEYELPKEHNVKGKTKRFIQKVIRKLARFLTKPYAEQMLKFQESVCELAGEMIEELEEESNGYNLYRKKIVEQQNTINKLETRLHNSENLNEAYGKTLGEHEEAIYKLTNDYNKTANLVLDINNSLYKGEDISIKSYSQAGEDVIVSYILNVLGEKKGYSYLDIGCNRYNELNNTYYFYKKGMRGVLIDANPKFIGELQENRPEDIVLNVGVGTKGDEKLIFYALNWDWLSSLLTMNDIYEKYFHGIPSIVSLDVEGDELSILKSVDMERYRPLIYIIETIEYHEKLTLNNKRNDIVDYMGSKGYHEYAFTGVNSIFIDSMAV